MKTSEVTTAIIPAGQRVAQFGAGRTITLSDTRPFPLQVTVKRHKPSRSDAQNRLAWMWASHISGETGDTKQYQYAMFKITHLAPVLARDDADFAELLEQFKGVMFGKEGTRLYASMADGFVSAGKSNTAQMAEALTEWEMTQADGGIVLPRPDDYLFALQIESYAKMPEVASA